MNKKKRIIGKITISNIIGIKGIEVDVGGKSLVVSGGNAAGKTSFVEAIRNLAKGGGSMAQIIRQGERVGQTVIEFEDGIRVEKTGTPDTAQIVVSDDTGTLSKPSARVKKFFNEMSNPVKFLLDNGKDRIKTLLDALGLVADHDKIREISGINPESNDALTAIEAARKMLFDNRTGSNRLQKEAGVRINTVQAEINAATAQLEDTDTEAASQAIVAIEQSLDEAIATIKNENASSVSTLEKRVKSKEEEIANAERLLAKYKAELKAKKDSLQGLIDTATLEAKRELEPHQQVISKAESQKLAITLIDQKRVQLQQEQAAQSSAAEESQDYTDKILALDNYKAELLANSGLDGISIGDNDICVNGFPWATLNDAERIRTAAKVAMLNPGECPLVILDKCEMLEPSNFQLLLDEIEGAGFQAIVTRVTSGPLDVRVTE